MPSLSLKASYKDTKRRFPVDTATSFAQFESLLSSLFSITPPFIIAYEDDEKDMVSVSSDVELKEIFKIASAARISLLRIHIYDAGESVRRTVPEPVQQETPRAAPQPQPQPQRRSDEMPTLDGILSGVAHVLAAMRSAETSRGSRRGPCAWAGPGRRAQRFPRGPAYPRGPGFRPGPRQGPPYSPFEGMASIFSSFAPLFAAFGGAQRGEGGEFFSRMQDISQETRDAFHALTAALMAAENRAAVMTSARNAFPIVRDWLRTNLGESGAVEQSAVDTLLTNVQNAVGAGLGQDVTDLVTTLLRTALGDSAVVDVLRQLPQDMPFEWEAELHVPMGREAEGAGGFSVHRRVECDNCGTSPIVGSRFKATNRPNYDLCATCYNSDSVSKEGMEFKECKFVWQSELEDAVVPPTPLSMGDRGPHVAFLQKLMTDLGYLNENMYRRAVGMFGPNTRMAVLQFQREYGLTEVAEEGVYDATTAASLTSVLEVQVPPTAATGGDTTGAGPSAAATEEAPKPPAAQG